MKMLDLIKGKYTNIKFLDISVLDDSIKYKYGFAQNNMKNKIIIQKVLFSELNMVIRLVISFRNNGNISISPRYGSNDQTWSSEELLEQLAFISDTKDQLIDNLSFICDDLKEMYDIADEIVDYVRQTSLENAIQQALNGTYKPEDRRA